jgi:glutamate/tyrosine decarboxylase-like PLP-dependent enzyme
MAVAMERALAYLDELPDRPIWPDVPLADLRAGFGQLNDHPVDPALAVKDLADAAEPGLVTATSPRYFGFVVGGAMPAAIAADWLAATWDQNTALSVGGPSAAAAEEVVGSWVLDLLGLPADASFAFVTGCQMAHVTGLAAARHHVLRQAGWDVERQGLIGAPPLRVLAGEARHTTIDRALRFLGLGTDVIEPVAIDGAGRMRPDALANAIASADVPTIVCAQVGEVNTGACDPVGEISAIAHSSGAWVHVDGAFGLWAAASPLLRHRLGGIETADSWATDFHKWLNVPYDSGFAVCAHPEPHQAAMATRAAYLQKAEAGGPRDPMNWSPDFSRRARVFAIYAALRSLGRCGVAAMVERGCAMARRFGTGLEAIEGAEVLGDVVLNQVLVRFRHASGDDAHTRRVVTAVQEEGTCYVSGTRWRGVEAMRICVVNWQTSAADVDRSLAAIATAAATASAEAPAGVGPEGEVPG